MPATTRSRTQTKLEDKGVSSSKPAPSKPSSKRKAPESKEPASKKQKTQPNKASKAKSSDAPTRQSTGDNERDSESIIINRAPVLELWASCVAHFLHPNISWTTALSIGGAISTITAISKGRSIGTIDKPDPQKAQEKREKRKEQEADLDEVEVMGFNLKIKDGSAMVGDKPKKGNEEALRKKYGESQYYKVKEVMEEALRSWKGKEEELDGRAFHMYEDFRPTVAAGQKGWGRKAELKLENVRSAVEHG